MLPKKHRLMLRHLPDFFVQSKKLHSPLFTIFYLVSENECSQGSVIVPKKNVAKSSGRNKIKRQVSELLSPILKAKPHLSVVVLVKKTLNPDNLTQLEQALNQL